MLNLKRETINRSRFLLFLEHIQVRTKHSSVHYEDLTKIIMKYNQIRTLSLLLNFRSSHFIGSLRGQSEMTVNEDVVRST